jgi:hypothetical protein
VTVAISAALDAFSLEHRRCGKGKYERLSDLAAELVRLKVDVIGAVATPAVGRLLLVTLEAARK